VQEELLSVAVALEEIDAGDLDGIVLVDAVVSGLLPFELADGAGADDDGFEVEFFGQLFLPLLAEVGRAEDAEALDLAAVPQLAGDEEGFDGLADADVVGDEEADGIEAEGHNEEGDELVDAGADGDAAEGAEGGGSFAQGEARGLPEEVGSAGVGEVVEGGGREGGWPDALLGEAVGDEVGKAVVDGDDVVGGAGEGAQELDIGLVAREEDPVSVAAVDDGAGVHGCGLVPFAGGWGAGVAGWARIGGTVPAGGLGRAMAQARSRMSLLLLWCVNPVLLGVAG